MDIYFCHATPMNYTLIPYTDQDLLAATRHFFPNTKAHFFEEDPQKNQAFLTEMHQAVLSERPMMVFDSNGKLGLHKSPIPVEQYKLSYYSDAPYEFLEFVQPMKSGATATYSDRSFKQFYEDAKFELETIFMPHGGPLTVTKGKPLADRKYPISFVGYIKNPEPLGAFETLLSGSDERLISIVKQASEMNLHEGVEAYIAFRSCALEAGFNPLEIMDLPVLGELLNKMGHWSEEQRRLQLLRAFKDFPLHIFGPVMEEVKGVTDQNHHFYGPTLGHDVIEMLKESRVLLNTVTKFPEGSHERIWFALAHGCMVYTDASRFVMETFNNDENILFIDYDNLSHDVERIKAYVEESERLQKIVEAALPIYQVNHTWLQRVESTFRQMPILAPYMPPLR